MSEFFLGVASDDEIQFDGFYDGQQKTIPDNTELEGVVIDGFNGIGKVRPFRRVSCR